MPNLIFPYLKKEHCNPGEETAQNNNIMNEKSFIFALFSPLLSSTRIFMWLLLQSLEEFFQMIINFTCASPSAASATGCYCFKPISPTAPSECKRPLQKP